MTGVRNRASGLEPLAMSMVLPHERKALRMPVVPATLTALLETMGNRTIPISDNSSARAFLCRDACYPLWMERTIGNWACYLQATSNGADFVIPAEKNKVIMLPVWDVQGSYSNAAHGAPTLDSVDITRNMIVDHTPLAVVDTFVSIYIPLNSTLCFRLVANGAGADGSHIELEFGYIVNGEVKHSTVLASPSVEGYSFLGTPGAVIPPNLGEGRVPYGFTWLRGWRTGTTAVTAASTPTLQLGWTTGGTIEAPTDTEIRAMLPVFNPPEFNNSTLPYRKTRLNASAALFTNVSAVLNKEGTVLASRLNPTSVDPWSFSASNIDSTHPKLRYYGPLEKGLYTFTTPGGNIDNLDDLVLTISNQSTINTGNRPLFTPLDMGIYNAIIFTDVATASAATMLAVSSYAHIEYETTSSLFPIGVSTMTLETLHAAEVALLGFGHFHENPTHWAVLAQAATAVLRKVAPMIAPVVAHYGQIALNKGVQMLKGKEGGDRKMPQASFQTKPSRAKPPSKKAKARKPRRGKA